MYTYTAEITRRRTRELCHRRARAGEKRADHLSRGRRRRRRRAQSAALRGPGLLRSRRRAAPFSCDRTHAHARDTAGGEGEIHFYGRRRRSPPSRRIIVPRRLGGDSYRTAPSARGARARVRFFGPSAVRPSVFSFFFSFLFFPPSSPFARPPRKWPSGEDPRGGGGGGFTVGRRF